MSAQRLLYLDKRHLRAFAWQGGSLQDEGSFADTPDGHAAFAGYVATRRRSTFSLLVDSDDEIHSEESIPDLRGQERRQLIARRLAQHFPQPALTIATSLGYEQGLRRNEKLLLSSLGHAAGFEPWRRALRQLAAPLRGIYAPSQLNGSLLARLDEKHPRCLLFTLNGNTLRENWLVDGVTRFSRRLTLADAADGEPGASIVREAGRLHQYLLNQRQLGPDEPVTVVVIADPADIESIRPSAAGSGLLNFSLVDTRLAAGKLRLRTSASIVTPELFYLQLLASKAPQQQFAPPDWRHDWRLPRIRRALAALSLLAIAGSALSTALTHSEIAHLQESARQIEEATAALRRSHPEPAPSRPESGISGDILRQIGMQHAELMQQQAQPGSGWNMVSQALEQVPSAHLEELDWKIVPSAKSTAQGISETITLRGSLQINPQAPGSEELAFAQLLDHLRNAPSRRVSILQAPHGNANQRFAVEITRSLP